MYSLKKINAVIILAALFLFSGYAQEGSFVQEKTAEEKTWASAEDESPLFFGNAQEQDREPTSRFGSFFLFVRMIIVLAVVVACIYGVMWFMKRSMKTDPDNNDPFLRRVSSVDISVGKSVHVVTLLDHAYIVGVADNSINLIGEVDDKELIDAMNLYADEHHNVKKPRSFSDVLDIFMPNGPREKKNVFADSQNRLSELLKKQRSRLNDGE